MLEELHSMALVLGGREVLGAADRVARYVGRPWSGGAPETWAFWFYDVIATDPTTVGSVDVLAAAALHPGLSRADLTWFRANGPMLDRWLAALPDDAALSEVDGATLERLDEAATWSEAPSLTLLTKVLHRKRPRLIPLLDRHILDWYRPRTGERNAQRAWPAIVRAVAEDTADETGVLLSLIGAAVGNDTGHPIAPVRVLDIVLWMGAQA